jgi:hypothetical protein
MSSLPPVRRIALLLALFALALVFAAPAQAGTLCNYTNTSAVFMPWLDVAQYTPFPGSGFEHGAEGWSWKGATIVGVDDNTALASGSHAVEIPGGGNARSPWLCVSATTPSMRFFVRRVSGTGNLHVQGVLNSSTGKISSLVATVPATGSWAPSPVVLFPPAFLTVLSTADFKAQFTLIADAGTTFRIDDIQLDPFKGH